MLSLIATSRTSEGGDQEEVRQRASVLEAPQRIEWIALDLVEHYRKTILPNGFKAMVVTSVEAAVTYKEKLSHRMLPNDHLGRSQRQAAHRQMDQPSHKARENFKKPISENHSQSQIVKDMLLTGFDAPISQVMYLDRIDETTPSGNRPG